MYSKSTGLLIYQKLRSFRRTIYKVLGKTKKTYFCAKQYSQSSYVPHIFYRSQTMDKVAKLQNMVKNMRNLAVLQFLCFQDVVKNAPIGVTNRNATLFCPFIFCKFWVSQFRLPTGCLIEPLR